MGCGASKRGKGALSFCKSEGSLVSLCKERKDLIKAARESRNAVSASHVLYLQSLLDFGEALDLFLKEASVDSASCSSEADSPLHSIEGSHLDLSSVDSESVFLGSFTDEVHQREKHGEAKNSSSSSKDSVDNRENESDIRERENVSRITRSSPEIVTMLLDPVQEFPASVGAEDIPNMHMPHMHYHPAQENFWFPAGAGAHSSGTSTHYYNGYNYYDYGDGSASSYVPKFSPRGQLFGDSGSEQPMGYFRDIGWPNQPFAPSNSNPIPIPSPPMANSKMDYFDFFSFSDDNYSRYYSSNIFDDVLGSKYLYLSNVLEEEGIPPLEEIEEDSPSGPFNMSADVRETQLDVQPVESDERHMSGSKNCNHSPGEEMNHVHTSIENNASVANTNKVEDDIIIEEAELSSQLKQPITPKRPVGDIFEAIQEINHAFLSSYNCGKEVAEILEDEKIPYLPKGSVLKGFRNTILGTIAPSTASLQATYLIRKKSAGNILKKAVNESGYIVKDISYKHGMMMSTLEKLYIWEKKLYKEVKIEEELRAVYEKLFKRRKMLLNIGAEPDKIEAVQLRIKKQLPKIDVSVSAVHAISRRIDQARDEELHPQISGLIHGLSRMWKSMSQCHQKQFQEAADAKEKHNVAKFVLQLDLNRTEDLKLKVLKWRSCLCDLINTHREFATFLVEWLSKFRREAKEDEMTQSSSSCTIEDLVVSVLSRGWLRALEATSVSRASEALVEFALALQNLWAKQNEEHALKLHMEVLESRIYASTVYAESHHQEGSAQELNTSRKHLEELKAVHAKVFDQVKFMASVCLTDGLVKVFSALESFCIDMSNGYDQSSVS